jgi:benzoyl-CoA reductase subunit B
MTDSTATTSIVGRGNAEGARLFREWFAGLDRAAEEGRGGAYVFVMGSLVELLRCFDFPIVFPEINSLQTAVRHVAHDLLNEAEDYGYSPDICGYVKADVATQLRGGTLPMGRIPRPQVAICTNACNTYIKWAEIWERMYGTPTFVLDVPGTRSAGDLARQADPAFENDRAYVLGQLQELIPRLEEISGIPFDVDRLRERLSWTNDMLRAWRRVLDLNRSTPALFNALTDGTVYLGVVNGLRATPEGATYFTELAEEMKLRRARGIGAHPEELHRLIFVGVPCYPIFRRFGELFSEWGGVFVSSTYMHFASGGAQAATEYDLERPLEALADALLRQTRAAMDSMFFQTDQLLEMVDHYQADGIVYHPIKSCRTVSTGLADNRRAVMERRDVPSLFIESDMMDRRVVSEAQLKNRIDAFFEGLAARRHQAGAST